jgi:hypothetical protein
MMTGKYPRTTNINFLHEDFSVFELDEYLTDPWDTAVAKLVEALCYKPEGHWIFQLTQYFQPHYGPGGDSASNRNEYQESSWG